MRRLLTAALALGVSCHAAMACDLDQVVGYTLYASKVIQAYIEDGKRVTGFGGCTRDRILVFTDNTGVRCKETFIQTGTLPKAYLFARDQNNLMLCVGDNLYAVAPAN